MTDKPLVFYSSSKYPPACPACPSSLIRAKSSTRPGWDAQIIDRQYRSLICEESGNDIFRFPQRNYGSQKAAKRLFATLAIVSSVTYTKSTKRAKMFNC